MGDVRGVSSKKVVKRVTKTTTTTTTKKKQEEDWPEEVEKKAEDEFERMEKEVLQQMEKEKKTAEVNGVKGDKKKKKKKKKDSEKENKKTTYQNKDDLYKKHVGPRIRSFDASKMKSKFNKPKESTQVSSECRICGKNVFQMEKIVAEKASWHKNCFRCKECNKQLTLETYQSHEGNLYCKPHFKELFRPKAVVQNEAEERKERLLRRPKMIVLESQPEQLPDDVIRSTAKPDYGLEDLGTLNVKQRFSMFENASKEVEEPKLEPVSVRRSQSLMSKAKRFLADDDMENGADDEEYEEEEEEEEDDEECETEDGIVRANRRKKERPMSFSGMGDLKNAWEQKNRREELTQARKDEVTRFRQMLCAGKNVSLKEKFESGNVNEDDERKERPSPKEFLKMDNQRAKSLKERFEKGEPLIPEDEDSEEDEEEMDEDAEEGEELREKKKAKRRSCFIPEKMEVEEVFKEAETAKRARNVFKQIDSVVAQEGGGAPVMRSQSFSQAPKEHRFSQDMSHLHLQKTASSAEVVKANEKLEDFHVDTTDLASRFKFFSTYEERLEEEKDRKRKVFRMTPPREGVDDQGLTTEDVEIGRDPNLIKCTDNYEDAVDCRNTKNILQMFKKLEMGPQSDEDDEEGPRPLKRFTPPPEDCESGSEYSDEEYTDDEEDEEEDEEEIDENGVKRPKYRDELLEMSARKAAHLRAKFEKWENEVERQNELNVSKNRVIEEDEECMPSLDTAKNLRAMFENKSTEEPKLATHHQQRPQRVNRFV